MEIFISDSREELGKKAASTGGEIIRKAIRAKGRATIILATGTSQFEMLGALVREEIDWSRVIAFHLDEYIGLPQTHPASFRKYLKERFVDLVSPGSFIYINGETNPDEECLRLGRIISKHQVDVAFVGIGENGHLAFNDPPADFKTEKAYIVVSLDEECRRQQMGEGWFAAVGDVPEKAISMSIRQIMKSEVVICTVPDGRKAKAVKNTLEGKVGPAFPASVLQHHKKVWLYLDRESAALLS